MEDLITVIVLIYNRDKYLHESIESILNQTYKNLEIILVDDGSTDNTLNICKYYERLDKRVKVFTQKNKGISISMRNALKISNGKYIARCDSDDINKLDRFEKQLKYLKDNDCDVVSTYVKIFGNLYRADKKLIEDFMNRPIENYEDQENRITYGGSIGGGMFFGKSSILKEINPFNKDYGLVEDVYMHILLHKNKCKLGIVKEVLYYYRMHKSNTSIGLNRAKVIEKHIDVLFNYFYRDRLYEFKNIVIIKKQVEESIIKNIVKKDLSDLNITFVNEYNLTDFIEQKLPNYNPKETAFFVGNMFVCNGIEYLKNRNYHFNENLFYLVDFY